jgi:hypothetical protein
VEDYHPELDNYEPHAEKPMRSKRTLYLMRGVVVLALAALVLPGLITTATFAQNSAEQACAVWASNQVAEQHRTEVHFEFFGEGVVGFECYATTALGERHLISLGLLPGLNAEQAEVIGV